MNRIKIGHNPTANMLPMFYFLDRDNPRIRLVTDVPTGHNRLLAEGKIDMAPISSFAYGENWQNYTILANLSVSAKGRVGSIFLFSKYRIEELQAKRIALTNMSATSVNLLKVIFKEFYGINPNYEVTEPDLHKMLQDFDAALLIADDAILGLSQKGYKYVYDLGEEWLKHTELPMILSLWTVSNETLSTNLEEVKEVHKLLINSKKQGLAHIDKIINYCMEEIGREYTFWQSYFGNLRYDLGEDLLEGLKKYYSLCYKFGLIESVPRLNII